MLNVESRPNIDTGPQELLDILIALGMPASRRVRVSEFIHDDERGSSLKRGVDVKLLHRVSAIFDGLSRQNLKTSDKRLRFSPSMGFHHADQNNDAFPRKLMRRRQHREGFANTGRGAEKYFELAASFRRRRAQQRVGIGTALAAIRSGHGVSSVRAYKEKSREAAPNLNHRVKGI